MLTPIEMFYIGLAMGNVMAWTTFWLGRRK